MEGRKDEWMDGSIDGWTEGLMDGWMDGWMVNGWMDGWIDIKITITECLKTPHHQNYIDYWVSNKPNILKIQKVIILKY